MVWFVFYVMLTKYRIGIELRIAPAGRLVPVILSSYFSLILMP